MFLYLPYEYSNEHIVDCFGRTAYLYRIHYSEPVVDGHHHWNSFWSADIEAVSFVSAAFALFAAAFGCVCTFAVTVFAGLFFIANPPNSLFTNQKFFHCL